MGSDPVKRSGRDWADCLTNDGRLAQSSYRGRVPRVPRLQLPDGIYHVGSRGVDRRYIFLDSCDRDSFLSMLKRIVTNHRWRCHGFCLMGTHYHLLIESAIADLSAGMQRLNSGYARAYNVRHGREGHLFERRFYSEFVQTEEHLYELMRYIACNPVRAGLCADPADWPWSYPRL
jgi:putative transposase